MPNVTFYISDSSRCSNFQEMSYKQRFCHLPKEITMRGRFGHCFSLSIFFFLFFLPLPALPPYSACASCFKSASHKKSLSQWNTAIWEIIEWWLGGTNASLRNYTTISPAFTTFLKASCHPGRKAPDWRFITSLSQHGGIAGSSPDATQQHIHSHSWWCYRYNCSPLSRFFSIGSPLFLLSLFAAWVSSSRIAFSTYWCFLKRETLLPKRQKTNL